MHLRGNGRHWLTNTAIGAQMYQLVICPVMTVIGARGRGCCGGVCLEKNRLARRAHAVSCSGCSSASGGDWSGGFRLYVGMMNFLFWLQPPLLK